ncbi:MAG TPA: hypothetical protein VJY99_09570, partial [Buttiauxella sp.]|uniref:hypothetical protein n=1 Tax=Buttiauxella sp. TaxID=1972222 RepID=UPI002B4730BD
MLLLTPRRVFRPRFSHQGDIVLQSNSKLTLPANDVEKVNQFDLEKRGFIRLEQNEEPLSFFQTPKEGWLRQAFGRL